MTTATAPQSTASNDVLTVHLDGRPHAVPLAMVLDVCQALPLLTVPGAPAHILGMAVWRGRVIPCIGLHQLGLADVQTVQRQFVMVILRLSHGEVALAVEAPVEVLTWPPTASGEAAEHHTAPAPAVPMLDVERLLPRYQVAGTESADAAKAPQPA